MINLVWCPKMYFNIFGALAFIVIFFLAVVLIFTPYKGKGNFEYDSSIHHIRQLVNVVSQTIYRSISLTLCVCCRVMDGVGRG